MKQIILKLAAYILFGFFTILSLGILSGVFFLSIWLKDANLVKIIILDLVIILIAFGFFIFGLGILEFVLSFIRIEEQVEEIEDILPKLEDEAGLKNLGNSPLK